MQRNCKPFHNASIFNLHNFEMIFREETYLNSTIQVEYCQIFIYFFSKFVVL